MRTLTLTLTFGFLLAMGCAGSERQLLVGPTFTDGERDFAAVEIGPRGRIVQLHRSRPDGFEGAILELPGKVALPGLHDAHLHLVGLGRRSERADLRGAESAEEVARRMTDFIRENPGLPFFIGRGWDQSRFPSKSFPTASALSQLTERPMILTRVDGHAAWVNDVLLKRSGVVASTEDPPGGRIMRDVDGGPTGVFIDRAMDLVRVFLPKPTDKDIARRLIRGARACVESGLVAVHDMGMSPRELEILAGLARADRLPPLRIFVYLDGKDEGSYSFLRDARGRPEIAHRITLMGIKLFADGALGSRGAALLRDYKDRPGQTGLLLMETSELRARVRRAHELGFQAAIHAIGDRGVRSALDAFGGAQGKDLARRHRVEHAQVVAGADFRRFADLGVIASMQPTHATSDMRWAQARIGAKRLEGAYAWQRMLSLGIPLAFGSDAPVEDHAPMWGIWAAVTRQDRQGHPEGGWLPTQRMTAVEAIRAFTRGAAYAVHREHVLGRLEVGFSADLTLLSEDPRRSAAGWRAVNPVGTVVDGRWTRGGNAAYHRLPSSKQ